MGNKATIFRTLLGAVAGAYGGHKLVKGDLPGVSSKWVDTDSTARPFLELGEGMRPGALKTPLGKGLGYALPTLLGAVMGAKGKGMFMRPGKEISGVGKLLGKGNKVLSRGPLKIKTPAEFSGYRAFGTAMTPVGLAAVPHIADHPTSVLLNAKNYIEQAAAEMGEFQARRKMNPKARLLTGQAKKIGGGILGDWWAKNKKDILPLGSEMARDLGLAAGGGVAGYYGGGALGGAIGRLIAPDKERGKYKDRRKAELTRDISKVIGQLVGSHAGALSLPLLVRRLSK